MQFINSQSCLPVTFRVFLASIFAGLPLLSDGYEILIDYDDGIAGNNQHDKSVRNGGFEDADSTNFSTTHFWDSVFPNAENLDPTLSTKSRSGSQRSFASGSLGNGIQIHLEQTLTTEIAKLQAGRTYTLSFYVRQGSGLQNLDEGLATLEIVDSLGKPVLYNGSNLLASQTFPISADDSWGLVRLATSPLPINTPFTGQNLRLRIQGTALLDHYFIIDDVSLTSTLGNPVPPLPLPTKPNIVIIYSDDVGYGDISANGSGIVSTPRIDSIAYSGIRFTDGHSPASTCTPSRYSMLTGEYAWRSPGTSIANGDSKLLIRPGSVTLPSMLRQAGYRTAVIGKWHLGLGASTTDYNATRIAPGPLEIGFDYWFGIPATNDRVPCVYMENSAIINLDRKNDPLQVSYAGPVGNLPTGASHPKLNIHYPAESAQHEGTIINGVSRIGWMSGGKTAWWRDEDHADVFAEKTKAYIKECVAAAKPFFLYFASPDIHAPRLPHERFQGKSPHKWRGDALLSLDFSTGEILDQLADPNGDGDTSDSVIENTLVIFTSDNGPVGTEGYLDGFAGRGVSEFPDGHDSNGIYTGGKYGIREGGTRVPFFVQWPGTIPAGLTSKALVSHTDFMTSFAALVNQPLPADAGPDSENILPALLGQSNQGRSMLITQNNDQNQKGVRLGEWKYFSNTGALHDLETDPSEATNLASEDPQTLSKIRSNLTKSEAIPLKIPTTGWWPFDGKKEDLEARDLSERKNSATLSGKVKWTHENKLPHLHFDGKTTRAVAKTFPATTSGFTLTTWARSDSPTWLTSGSFFSRRPTFAFGPIAGTKTIRLDLTSADSTPHFLDFDLATLTNFDLQAWHHFAATYDSTTGTAQIIIDGISRASTTFPDAKLFPSVSPLYLGSDANDATLAGDLSDTRLYSQALPFQRSANIASARLDDSDQDGMLSDWEHHFNLDPFNPADASGDPDSDAQTNLDEFRNNTSPTH